MRKFASALIIGFASALAISSLSLAQGAPMTSGEVTKVDQSTQRVTIKHGPMPHLDMPAMTVEALTPDRPIQLAQAGSSSAFTPEQKAAIERIIKDYLLANPELLLDVQTALDAKMDKIQAERADGAEGQRQ